MRIVAHLDMDAFYAAVEERDHPELAQQPIAVGADPQEGQARGVVTTANYLARAYGLHSAMPISRAWRLGKAAVARGEPPVIFRPMDMPRYRQVSNRIMALLRTMAPLVEQASIDEAYLDVSETGGYDAAETLCRTIKRRIVEEERLTASVGIGPNKLIAKIASGMRKPDGLTVVAAEAAESFLAPLPLRAIPGIGPKTEALLAADGFTCVQDLTRLPSHAMQARFGKRGGVLYERLRGIDETPVVEAWESKSIGEQETFERDTRDPAFLTARVTAMCQGVIERLHEEGFVGFRTVVITVRFADFDTKTRSRTVSAPHTDGRLLQAEAIKLFLPFLDRRENLRRKAIRLLGVRLEHLVKEDAMAMNWLREAKLFGWGWMGLAGLSSALGLFSWC